MKYGSVMLALTMLLFFGSAAADDMDVQELPTGIMKLPGQVAPDLVLSDMDGAEYDLGSARGRWVLVHFWASWCGPCRREMPTLQSLKEKLPEDVIDIVLVNTSETDEEVFEFLSITAPDLSALMDYDGEVTRRWQPRGLPASFIIDPLGRMRYLALGDRQWSSQEYIDFLMGLGKERMVTGK